MGSFKKNATFFLGMRVLLKRMQLSFIKNVKERKERNVFYKECKRMQRMERSFIKNIKERKEQNVLF